MDILRFVLFYTSTHFTCVSCSTSRYAARMAAINNDNLRMGLRNATVDQFQHSTIKPISDMTPVSSCICSQIYDPICGSNGLSYFNRCRMECDLGPNHDVSVVHQGNCIPYK